MAAFPHRLVGLVTALLAVATLSSPLVASAQTLPWEITVAEVEAGRLRHLAQRLNKQNLLYHLRLGDVGKEDVIKTASAIDQILESLEYGVPARSIPAPWTDPIREQIAAVDRAWSPLRSIAMASPYEHLRVAHQFLDRGNRLGDPLLLKYFDTRTLEFVELSSQLVAAYNDECLKTGLETCPTASTSGIAAMLMERAVKEAIYLVADIEPEQSRARLQATIDTYIEVQRANNTSEFFKAALDPERGISARAAGELLASLRKDWSLIQGQLKILSAGDEQNFDLRVLLLTQVRMVNKVERLTAALVRYANLTYGS